MIVHNVSVAEAVALITTMTSAKLFLGMPRTLAEIGGPAAWLILLLSFTHMPLTWLAVSAILKRYPGKSLITATEAILGPVFAVPINFFYVAYFVFLATAVLREFADALSSVFMQATPLPFLAGTMAFTSIYLAYLGFEALTRTALLGAPLMAVGFATLLFAGLMTHNEPQALAPYWGTGPTIVIGWGLIKDFVGDFLIFGIVAPAFRSHKQLGQAVWITTLLTAIVTISSEIVYLHVFPYPAAARIVLPLLQLSRMISLGPGIQRLESVFFVVWMVGAVLKLGAAYYAGAFALSQTLKLPSQRHLLVPLGVLTFHLALYPTNLAVAVSWDVSLRNVSGLVTVGLPALTALVALLRGKRGRTGAQA